MTKVRESWTPERKEAARAKNRASEAAFKAAVARMPDLPPDQMDEHGCINLVTAFWADVHHDLACRNRATIAWLDTPGFEQWAHISRQDPAHVRAFLLANVVGNKEYRSKARGLGGR